MQQIKVPRPAEYIRLPIGKERDPHTGLSRSTLDRLVRAQPCNDFKPPVESRVVNVRGNPATKRGIRLIRLQSLLDYLNSRPAGQVIVLEEEATVAQEGVGA
jgi:hypothetical protein